MTPSARASSSANCEKSAPVTEGSIVSSAQSKLRAAPATPPSTARPTPESDVTIATTSGLFFPSAAMFHPLFRVSRRREFYEK